MSDEALAVALASDNLNIDEVDIIKAVREWATVNSVSHHSVVSFIIRYVLYNVANGIYSHIDVILSILKHDINGVV